MDWALALLAAVASTAFSIDLWRDYLRRPRPHIVAYGLGISMFAIASWAFYLGVSFGWTGWLYRVFFLFGATLNILFLAMGSMFLVVGRRAGHLMAIFTGAIAAISITLTTTVPFVNPFPETGVPHDLFATGFSPRLFAIIGGALGTTILVALSAVSIFRFWRKNRRLVWGNLLIVGGTLAAASGGTGLALGEESAFAVSLFIAITLIWAGYRVASGGRQSLPGKEEEAGGQKRMHHA